MKTCLLPLLTLSLISCQPDQVETEPVYEATFVEYNGLGCRLPVIEFTKGLEQARKLTDARDTYRGYFSAYGLDTTYWQRGRKLKLTIREATQATVCDALGATYPAIDVVSVR